MSGVTSGQQLGLQWSAEATIPVTAGVPQTLFLAGIHWGSNVPNDCSGTFMVQVFTGTLP
jgi:hypothetical protein